MAILEGDCLVWLKRMPAEGIDAVVTDPPYDLGFMGKAWDKTGIAFRPETWREVLRVMKPGAHLLAFGGTRTYHRMAVAIEDAGFEVRDMVSWLYGSGFPKSMNVGKAIDKAAGREREVGPVDPSRAGRLVNQGGDYETDAGWSAGNRKVTIDPPATPEAAQWEGWGTALKPACEPIVLARKPLGEKTVAGNVLRYGTGALNVDGTRVTTTDNLNGGAYAEDGSVRHDGTENWRYKRDGGAGEFKQPEGRWPANVIMDEEAGAMLGEASRFFYCPKTSRSERNAGLDSFTTKPLLWSAGTQNPGSFQAEGTEKAAKNNHPTVKPIALMRYLIRLITPPNGHVLDPFAGSGSTGIAAMLEGMQFTGIELDGDYVKLARARIRHWEALNG